MKKAALNFDTPTAFDAANAGQGTSLAANPAAEPVSNMHSDEVLRISRQAVRTTQRARQREGLEFYSGQMSTGRFMNASENVSTKNV